MKKQLEIIVFHLGYGGIEKAVSSLVNLLHEDYEVSILSFYHLYENPIFPLPNDVKITYLYDTDVPLKVKAYKQLLQQKKIGKLFSLLWKNYGKGFHLFQFLHDFIISLDIYFLKGRFRKLKKYLKRSKKDIYISTRYETSKYLGRYGNSSSLKIGWEHNHHHGNMDYRKKVVDNSKSLDSLVLVSRNLCVDYQKSLSNCVYIPNMLDYDLPFVSDYKEKRILMVGRLEKEKGFFDAIEVAKRLQERQISFHVDIVGDGPLYQEIEKHIQMKGLYNEVKLHGFQNHKYIEELLKHTSLYLMTSYTESFGLVLLEAMNASVPCLSFTSAEGAVELISNHQNGELIVDRDINVMANRIEELLNNPSELERLGKNAKEFSKNYLPNSVSILWKDLLKKEKK